METLGYPGLHVAEGKQKLIHHKIRPSTGSLPFGRLRTGDKLLSISSRQAGQAASQGTQGGTFLILD
jgi:hypothetical protein